MHQALSILAATTTTVAGTKKTTSSAAPLLIIIVLFAAAYFLFIRPRSQRMRQQQVAARQIAVGDEVVSAGGIHGRVVSLSDDLAEVEVAPGVVLTFLRRAVSAKPGSTSATTGASTTGDSDDLPALEDGSGDHGEVGEERSPDDPDHPGGGAPGPAKT